MATFHVVVKALLFIPVCVLLFLVGAGKGIIFGPVVFVIIVVGHTAVTFGLWPVHVVMTYYSVAKARRLGISAKLLSFLCLPVPLVLWPITVLVGSILVGLGYGFLTPLVATFEAVGEGAEDEIYHCFVDGTWDVLKGSCTVVRDFTDLSYHSFMDYLTDFREKRPKNDHPYDIKLLEIPGCVLVAVLGVLLDVPLVTSIAIAKSPIMLFKGWQRLLKDVYGRKGPFLEPVCVPFAGLAIVMWPLLVLASILASILASPFLGLYGAVVVYQEGSFRKGLAYIVNVLAQYDEYTNDVLHLREGSVLPRPKYRDPDEGNSNDVGPSKTFADMQRALTRATEASESERLEPKSDSRTKGFNESPSSSPSPQRLAKTPSLSPSLVPLHSKSLRKTIQEVKVVQIWDSMFHSMDKVGKEFIKAGVITTSDLEGWLQASKKDKSKMITVGLSACSCMNSLLFSVRAGAAGLLLHDGTEVTVFNKPQDKLSEWLYEPLLVLKEQLKAANLSNSERHYMEKWMLTSGAPSQLDSWQNGGIEPTESLRRGELQALCRRMQGISITLSRFPTYPRRYQTLIQSLLQFARSHSTQQMPSPSQGDESV